MGGLGLLQEQISQQNHDSFGADGWEISAHAACAPDHEPIQGKQYTDAEYQALNNSLVRRIGTLNCGHAAFPIVLGISEPQYTGAQLQKFRDDNASGVDYQGRHYSMYEATQKQRQVERCIRKQKNRILVDENTNDTEKLQIDQIRLQRLNQEYSRFSKTVGLPMQRERAQVAGFGRKQAAQAAATYKIKKVSQSGGKFTVGDAEWQLRRETEASTFYDKICTNDSDVITIAKISGMSVQNIQQIKNHVFFNRHIKWDGSVGRFDPDYNMAVAWKRLLDGNPNETDILLLKHELLESQYEKEYNLTADKAHRMASETYDWNKAVKELYGEDGEPDGLL